MEHDGRQPGRTVDPPPPTRAGVRAARRNVILEGAGRGVVGGVRLAVGEDPHDQEQRAEDDPEADAAAQEREDGHEQEGGAGDDVQGREAGAVPDGHEIGVGLCGH